MVPRSPVSRKRGSVAVSTTGSRTITSPWRVPTLSFDQATAITRTVPAKAGMSKATSAVPSRPDRDDAGIERERRLGRRAALQVRPPPIAAGADLAARALHAVDQLAVEIADLGRELALAEIIVVRRRRLVVGEIENADIDGGDDDARLLAGEPVDLDRHAQRRVRPHELRQPACRAPASWPLRSIENHCTPMARPGMRSPRVERTPQRRDHIGAVAPVASDRDADLVERPAARPASPS